MKKPREYKHPKDDFVDTLNEIRKKYKLSIPEISKLTEKIDPSECIPLARLYSLLYMNGARLVTLKEEMCINKLYEELKSGAFKD